MGGPRWDPSPPDGYVPRGAPEPPPPGGYVPRGASPVRPRRVPASGVVLRLDAGQWGPTSQPWPLTVLVDRARPEISLYYDGDRCWIAGTVLNEDGRVVEERQVLVDVDAIPDDAVDRSQA